jgi:enamine deaminase RidA (YjgF/YER057c/UK114 family)
MPSEIDSSVPSSEPVASRREFVAGVTVAAAVGTAGTAQPQTVNPLRYSNPDGMTKPTAYSQVVEVNGPHRIIFIAGQTGAVGVGILLDVGEIGRDLDDVLEVATDRRCGRQGGAGFSRPGDAGV